MRKQTASVYFISFVSIKGFKKRSVVKYAKIKNARSKRTKVMFFIEYANVCNVVVASLSCLCSSRAAWLHGSQLLNRWVIELLNCCNLSTDLKCTWSPSQEDRGAFGRNPCLKELKGIWHDLLCVQKEEKMIASIFNTTTLIGRQQKKSWAMKRISLLVLIQQSMKSLRESGELCIIGFCPSLQFIGCDVKIEFEVDKGVRKWENKRLQFISLLFLASKVSRTVLPVNSATKRGSDFGGQTDRSPQQGRCEHHELNLTDGQEKRNDYIITKISGNLK